MHRRLTFIVALLALLFLTACAGEPKPAPVISPSANLHVLEGGFRGSKTLAELLEVSLETALTVYTQAGALIPVGADAELEVCGGEFCFQDQALLGIVQDSPALVNTQAHAWALAQVEAGSRALVVLVDGLGYEVYCEALEQGLVPGLAQGDLQQALTVYRPVTNAGLAAILTGSTPSQNGIHDRDNRQPQVPDILETLADMGKTGVVVEGAINILDLGGEVLLNSDIGGDGFSDDDIQAAALARIGEGCDYMLVHFHSLDDAGHDWGPRAQESMDRLAILDQYVQELRIAWPGPVLVVADHGMHKTEEGGSHGEFRYEDLVVPIITFPWEATE